MKSSRNHLIAAVGATALVAGIAAPVTQAGHDDFGVRCSLAMTQHRPDVAKICASDTSRARHTRGAAAPAPHVTIVQPGTFHWGDAGIGAAGAVGLVALAGGVVVLSRDGSRSGESTGELSEAGNA
jgi:hypothetical protein